MGIYIKGIELPKYCDKCLFTIDDECMFNNLIDVDTGNAVFDECPLVEVPEPHGRLIDADVAQDRLLNIMCGTGYQSRAISAVIYEYITPTVIESEE